MASMGYKETAIKNSIFLVDLYRTVCHNVVGITMLNRYCCPK